MCGSEVEKLCATLVDMSRTVLYLMRHGQASGHDDDDPALSELGERQATASAAVLRATELDGILHSSRRRAVETAAVVGSALDLVPEYSPAADDLTPTPRNADEIPARYRAFFSDVPRGEQDLGGARLDRAIAELGRLTEADRSLLVVTHAFVIGWFVRHALDAPWWRWIGLQPANGSLTTVTFETDREIRVTSFNERSHLPTH